MKAVKKVFSAVMAFLILSTLFIAPSVSSEEEMTDAQKCGAIGMLVGTGDGLTQEYLSSNPQRYQSAIMFLRLLGLEQEAYEAAYGVSFNDMEGSILYQKGQYAIAYLKQNPELGFEGYPDGSFKPFDLMNAQAYYKVLLTALGYKYNTDFTWNEVFMFAASKGLFAVASVTDFTVNDLATATVEALMADVSGGPGSLISKLVTDGAVTESAAVSAGLYSAPAIVPAVEEITADNLKQVNILFNKAIDASTAVNSSFTIDGAAPKSTVLSADKKTVTLTVADGNEVPNGGSYTVVVKTAIKDTSGNSLPLQYTQAVTALDSTFPSVEKIELTGLKTFNIVFNEPIKVPGTVEVENGRYSCSITGGIFTDSIEVTLSVASLINGSYDISISGFKDFSGLSMASTEKVLSYRKDTSPITAVVESSTQTQVTVVFNRPVTLNPAVNAYRDYFYHTMPTYIPSSVAAENATSTDDKWILTFNSADHPIPGGSANFVIDYNGNSNTNITDSWGNKLTSDIIIPITVIADTTKPYVENNTITVENEQTIKVKFSEAVINANLAANFVVKNSWGNTIPVSSITYTDSAKTTTIIFANKLSGSYTCTISNVSDTSLSGNVIDEVTLAFTVHDRTAPDTDKFKVTAIDNSLSSQNDIIYVYFGEEMATSGPFSILSQDKYMLAGSTLPADTVIGVFGGGTSVARIILPDASAHVLIGATLEIGKVADVSGNAIEQFSVSKSISAETAPAITRIIQTSANKIVYEFDKIVQNVQATSFTYKVGAFTYNAAMIEDNTDNNRTVITATLSSEAVNAIKALQPLYGEYSCILASDKATLGFNGGTIVSDRGMPVASDINLTAAPGINLAVEDAWAPEYEGISNNGAGKIHVKLSEPISSANEALYAHDFIVKKPDGTALIAGIDYTTTIPTIAYPHGRIMITLSGVADAAGYKISTKDSITYIKDVSGNKLMPFAEVSVPAQ